MEQMSFARIAIAGTAFACATLLSLGWSEPRGMSLSIESAQARVVHPSTSRSAASVSHRHYPRAAYARAPDAVGAGVAAGTALAAGAVGTAAAVATAPFGYYGPGPYAGDSYFAKSPWGEYECRPPHAYGCSPYASKDWSHP
jgi:hypothetical protein